MTKKININKRFKWMQLEGIHFLHLNLFGSTEEERIAAIYQLTHYGNEFPDKVNKASLIIKCDRYYDDNRILKHLIIYLEEQSRFHRIVFYGNRNEFLIAKHKMMSLSLKKKVALLSTKKEAFKYVSLETIQ